MGHCTHYSMHPSYPRPVVIMPGSYLHLRCLCACIAKAYRCKNGIPNYCDDIKGLFRETSAGWKTLVQPPGIAASKMCLDASDILAMLLT
jgi:hypothetical protein